MFNEFSRDEFSEGQDNSEGLITKKERDALVKQAAHSDKFK